MYDRKKKSGLLYEKVRYKHRKKQTKKAVVPATPPRTITETDKDEIQELIAFFESCVLEDQMPEILDKMKASAVVRKASNDENREFFDKCFHLYRVDPALVKLFCLSLWYFKYSNIFFSRLNEKVLMDFTFMFPDVDPDALFKKWRSIEKKPFELHHIQLEHDVSHYHRDEFLHNMLTFLKMLPTHRFAFNRSVTSLIIFSEVKLQ